MMLQACPDWARGFTFAPSPPAPANHDSGLRVITTAVSSASDVHPSPPAILGSRVDLEPRIFRGIKPFTAAPNGTWPSEVGRSGLHYGEGNSTCSQFLAASTAVLCIRNFYAQF